MLFIFFKKLICSKWIYWKCFIRIALRLFGARMSEDELNKMMEVLNQKEIYDKMTKVIQFSKTK